MCSASALFHLRYKKGARGKSPDSRNRLKRLNLFSHDIYTRDAIFFEFPSNLIDGWVIAANHSDSFEILAPTEHVAHGGYLFCIPSAQIHGCEGLTSKEHFPHGFNFTNIPPT